MHRAYPLGLHVLFAGLAAGLLAAPSPAASAPPKTSSTGQDGSSRRSLEDILKEVRLESSRAAGALQPEVARIVAEIDDLRAARTGPKSDAKRRELTALGPAALPLLVPYLEPGKDLSRQTVFRSRLVGKVLRERPAATTTDALLDMASTGSSQARRNALYALEATPEPQRVAPAAISLAKSERMDGLLPDGKQSVVNAAFSTLAQLSDQRAQDFIAESVRSSDPTLCQGALLALASAPPESSGPQMLAFLETLEDAKLVAAPIVNYYEEHDILLEEPEHARALARIAVLESTPSKPRMRMFDVLRVTDAKIGSPLKRDVEPFRRASRPDMRKSAQMLLARLKDRNAKNDLFEKLDNAVKKNKSSIAAHSARAEMHYAVGDWSAAERDWRVVMKLMAEEEFSRARKGPYIGIARALARMRKFRDAASYLSRGPISVEELQALGKERDFKEMKESRFSKVFE